MSLLVFLQELKKRSTIVSPVAFAMGACISSENGEFFYDRDTDSWQWWWGGSLWTWQPFYIPEDIDADVFRMNGGVWMSDYGEVWLGVDPNLWARAYATRMRRSRRGQDFVKYRLVRRALLQLIPEDLAEDVLTFGIGGTTAQRSTDAAAGEAADVAAVALKPFQELVNSMVL